MLRGIRFCCVATESYPIAVNFVACFRCRRVLAGNDRVAERADAIDRRLDKIAGIHEAATGPGDAFGSAGKDDVPGLQRGAPVDIGQYHVQLPGHFSSAGILTGFAIDLERKWNVRGAGAELVPRYDPGAEAGGLIKAFGRKQVEADPAALKVAGADIVADRIAQYAWDWVVAIGDRQADDGDELDLIIQLTGQRRMDDVVMRPDQCAVGFQEGDRCLGWLHLQFQQMLQVIRTDDEDLTCRFDRRQQRDRGQRQGGAGETKRAFTCASGQRRRPICECARYWPYAGRVAIDHAPGNRPLMGIAGQFHAIFPNSGSASAWEPFVIGQT